MKHLQMLVLVSLMTVAAAVQALAMLTPVLHFDGIENYTIGAQHWVRYKLSVVNRASFPAYLFTPAPRLPPCGANPNSSRAWVDVFSGTSPYARIYGFCALTSPNDMGQLWFAVEAGQNPPRLVFIKITDRLQHEVRASNRVATH